MLVNAAKRGGGEVGPSIVLRDPQLDERPWTYLRFSKQSHETREDACQLERLIPLEQLVESFRVGLERPVEAHRIVEFGENGHTPQGAVPCYGGRSIQHSAWLGVPVCVIKSDGLSADMWLRPGDVFVRTLVGYLNSQHARNGLIAEGVQTTLTLSVLQRLEVPDPAPDVLKALGTLSLAERRYRQWADEAQAARQELFAASSYGQQVTALLERQWMTRILMHQL